MVTMKWDVAQKWITAPKDRAYYSQKPADSRSNSSRYIELLRYSVNKTNVDLAKYDLFVLVFAGRGAEESRNNLDLWSWAFWPVDGSGPLATLGTYAIRAFALVPEIAGIGYSLNGVYAHEIGHILGWKAGYQGLVNLYLCKGNETVPAIDDWSPYDEGSWLGFPRGSMPVEAEAWSRIRMGWLTTQNVSLTALGQSVVLQPLEQSTGTRVARLQLRDERYLLIELRRKVGFDTALPAEGVIVTVIDETKENCKGIVRLYEPQLEPYETLRHISNKDLGVHILILPYFQGNVLIRISSSDIGSYLDLMLLVLLQVDYPTFS